MPAVFPPHISDIITALERTDYLRDPSFDTRASAINQVCRGWSSASHYAFFAAILDSLPNADRWLMLGVYEGRDLSYIRDHALQKHAARSAATLKLTGIDLFSDGPCNDWPAEARGKTWEQAGFGPPPTVERAHANLQKLHPAGCKVRLFKGSDAELLPKLAERKELFDVIYIDTSHDHATVARQLRQVAPLCHAGTVLCGDDYHPRDTWDVKGAVTAALPSHVVFGGMIWLAAAPH